jgi:hypothetical protein
VLLRAHRVAYQCLLRHIISLGQHPSPSTECPSGGAIERVQLARGGPVFSKLCPAILVGITVQPSYPFKVTWIHIQEILSSTLRVARAFGGRLIWPCRVALASRSHPSSVQLNNLLPSSFSLKPCLAPAILSTIAHIIHQNFPLLSLQHRRGRVYFSTPTLRV